VVDELDAYADLDTFRLFIRDTAQESEEEETDPDDALLTLALEAAARAIDTACNRDFRTAGDAATARYFTADARHDARPYRAIAYGAYVPSYLPTRYVLDVDAIPTDTNLEDVEVDFDTSGNGDYNTPTTDFRLGPSNAAAKGKPYTQIIFDLGVYPPNVIEGVRVSTKWGWDATPSTISFANMLQAARFYKRRDAVFGVAGSPDFGNELRLLAKLDPDVALLVAGFRRDWAAA
jgi:hypothetical protein